MKKIIVAVTLLLVAQVIMVGCGSKDDTIKIGHKNYTEQRIVGQMFATMIDEHTDYKTTITELGGTSVCLEALKADQIQVYPEYTGTGYAGILGQMELRDPDAIYDYCQKEFNEKYNITWLKPLGYNNAFTLTMRKDHAEELGIKTISDLVAYSSELIIGADVEFLERKDGLASVRLTYGIDKFKEEKAMEIGLTYSALMEGDLDINDSYSTDGRIQKFNLFSLEDDKKALLPYYISPLVNETFLDKYPDAEDALNKLNDQFTDKDMQVMNLAVDEGADPKVIVEQWLKDKGLIE